MRKLSFFKILQKGLDILKPFFVPQQEEHLPHLILYKYSSFYKNSANFYRNKNWKAYFRIIFKILQKETYIFKKCFLFLRKGTFATNKLPSK